MIRSLHSDDKKSNQQQKRLFYGVFIIVLSGLIFGGILAGTAIQQHLLRNKRGPVYQLEAGTPFIYENTNINEVIQFLATKGELQYFHNPQLKGTSYKIHGQFEESFTPMQEIDKLVLKHDLKSLILRDTLYLFTASQFVSQQSAFTEARKNNKDWQSPKYIPAPENAQDGFFNAQSDFFNTQGDLFITGAYLNDIAQPITQSANLNYFHNAELLSPKYIVSGHLHAFTDACEALELLTLAYQLKVVRIRHTVYIFTPEQYAQREASIKILLSQNRNWQPAPKKTPPNDEDVFFLREANINDVIQYIATSNKLSYWENPQLQGSKYEITGPLHSITPAIESIEELALIHNLKALIIDGKIHLFTPQQWVARNNAQTK